MPKPLCVGALCPLPTLSIDNTTYYYGAQILPPTGAGVTEPPNILYSEPPPYCFSATRRREGTWQCLRKQSLPWEQIFARAIPATSPKKQDPKGIKYLQGLSGIFRCCCSRIIGRANHRLRVSPTAVARQARRYFFFSGAAGAASSALVKFSTWVFN